jgi:hypothetical protein
MAGFTMAGIALALAAGGTAVNVYGGIKAGNAAKRGGEAQQRAADASGDLADFNAQVADLQADDAITRGVEEQQRFRTKVRQAIGSARVGFAAGNIDVSQGSAADVQADAAFLGELDTLTIAGNAAREAWGFKMQAQDYRARGDLARQEGVAFAEAGRANQTASRIGAVSNLLTSSGSLLASRYGFGKGA